MLDYIFYLAIRFVSLGSDNIQSRLEESRQSKENPIIHVNALRKLLAIELFCYLVSFSVMFMRVLMINAHQFGKYWFGGTLLCVLVFYLYLNRIYPDNKIFEVLDEQLNENSETPKRDFVAGLALFFGPVIILTLYVLVFQKK